MKSINLVFVDAKTSKGLNKKYRNLDKVPTVLSFNYLVDGQANFPNENRDTNCLGEIVICLSEAEKQGLKIETLINHGLRNLLSEIPTTVLKRPGSK